MMAQHSPHEAYRRVEFDARVEGANPQGLVTLCYEQLVSALGGALIAQERGDNARKSASLTRALSAVTALQLGVAGDRGIAAALHQFYAAARRTLLDSVIRFDGAAIEALRQDIAEIAGAMQHQSGQ